VTTIDPRHSVAGALQARLAAARPRSRAGAAPGAAAPATVQATASALAQRIAAIAPGDPDGRRKAVRVVLEIELARAFGSALLNDPGFAQMLDAVQDQMQADAQSATAVHALGGLLLAGA